MSWELTLDNGVAPRELSGGGPNRIGIQLESRLPMTLRRGRYELDRGVWKDAPPVEVGSFSVANWMATPRGFLGRQGVKGSVRYCCDWGGSVTILHVAFEYLLFGDRRITCREETSEGDSVRSEQRILCIHCEPTDVATAAASTVQVLVELREQVARHVSVDSHRMNAASVAESLRGGKLATVLRQASRSCLVRITNLTQFRLSMDGRGFRGAHGFWVAEPASSIDPHSFSDFGISNAGSQLSTRGSLCYLVEAPKSSRERCVQLTLNWEVPWIRPKTLSAVESGDVLGVKVFVDKQQNLLGVVHIVDPACLPTLEVLYAVALARGSGNGENATELVQELTGRHELIIPSVRVFLGQVRRRARLKELCEDPGEEGYTGLQISYRIGPEVFRRAFAPNERAYLSAALPGGDGEESTVLAALEAQRQESVVQPAPKLSPVEQALLLQRHLSEGLSPLLWKVIRAVPQSSLPKSGHWWPASGSAGALDIDGVEKELDAEGVLQVLRRCWPQITSNRYAALRQEPIESLIEPLEELCQAWTLQADMEPALISEAAVAGAKLCRLFDLEEVAAGFDKFVPEKPRKPPAGSPLRSR